MAVDRKKGLRTAERLLKQGKLQAALAELRKVSEGAPNDLLTMNRLGDLLARQGRSAEAIAYYRKIAQQFAQGGFLPKAAAIYKKILRLDPHESEAMAELGALYIRQNLIGEARSYLLHAANQFLEGKDYTRARGIYEQLAEAQPDDVRHRVRLAETRAAEGDMDGAVLELIGIGRSMLGVGSPSEAEKIFNRAREMHPESAEAVMGLASCLNVQGRGDEALAMLEQAASKGTTSAALVGELALRYQAAGRGADAVSLLEDTTVLEIPPPTWLKLFQLNHERGEVEGFWKRMDPLFRAQVDAADPQPLVEILEELAGLEAEGHIPALERLLEWQEARGDTQGTADAIEWLVRAYRARSMNDEASALLERLRTIAPTSVVAGGAEAPAAAPVTGAPSSGSPAVHAIEVPSDAETPAVPLNRADEEFVASRLTQAEVLQKYGLRPQALEQIEEVSSKFPGHVEAQEIRVSMLRSREDPGLLASALVQLAVALRAAGDAGAARAAAAEADSIGSVDEAGRARLEQLGLLGGQRETGAVTAIPLATTDDGDDVVIDFEAPAPQPTPAAPAAGQADAADTDARKTKRTTRVPSRDMIQEIQGYVSEGEIDEARRRIEALHLLGYASDELDRITAAFSTASPAPSTPAAAPPRHAPQPEPAEAAHGNDPNDDDAIDFEDDDLRSITAALESELFDEETKPIVPEEEPDQSLDEIFAAFKARVKEEIDSDDHRTHYDLGIAYKEMGLIDEAIHEFQVASESEEFHRESCSMIAMCYRERDEMGEAARWYQTAIDASNGEGNVKGLRYDLADVLIESGDREGALEQLRGVMQDDPEYRDVEGRVRELEAQLR